MRRSGLRAVAGVLLFALALGFNWRLERISVERPREHSRFLPSGRYLKWASLGFRGLLADALYVWSIQYYSSERAGRWLRLVQTYDIITELDPRFVAAYSVGALIISLEAGQLEQALALLDKGTRRNPEQYLLPWEAAFYARDLGDHQRMIAYLEVARSRPDAPSYVGRWHAYTLDKIGQRPAALRLWREAYDTARNDYERQVAQRYLDALELEDLLDRIRVVIDEFHGRMGRWPVSLEELVASGRLPSVPIDPAGRELIYEPADGSIRAVSGFLKSHGFQR